VTNPIFDVEIRLLKYRILKLYSQSHFIFHKNTVVEAIERHRLLAGIEAKNASVFVRCVKYLPGDKAANPTSDVGHALRIPEVAALPPQLPSQ
jgi:hypothetical protein